MTALHDIITRSPFYCQMIFMIYFNIIVGKLYLKDSFYWRNLTKSPMEIRSLTRSHHLDYISLQ